MALQHDARHEASQLRQASVRVVLAKSLGQPASMHSFLYACRLEQLELASTKWTRITSENPETHANLQALEWGACVCC